MTARCDPCGPSSRPVALVTGGIRRVGRVIARTLAQRGCDLILTTRTSLDEAEQCKADLAPLGVGVRVETLDLDDLEAVEALADRLAGELDRLDIIIHNASAYAPTPIESVTANDAMRFMRINAIAPLLLSARLAPLLTGSPRPGGGSIVALADIHAMGRPRKSLSAYSMSKAALVEMVRSLSRDLAPGVRVNGVAPGVVAWPTDGPDARRAMQEAYLARVPLARAGTPTDAAEAVAWLALDAPYITGTILRVDGGRWLA